MCEIESLLRHYSGVEGWNIQRPHEGASGRPKFVARRNNHVVFVTLDVPVSALRRLAALGVTPNVLDAGIYEGRTYCIQEYLAGTRPDVRWFSSHMHEVATLIRTYHKDSELQRLAAESAPTTGESAPQWEVRQLEERARSLGGTCNVLTAVAEFVRQAESMPAMPLVATHSDPNLSNFVLYLGRTYLVDWDDVVLSHPGRDLGPLLWWYFSPENWEAFLDAYGMGFEPDVVYWWAARISLAVAIWFVERDTHAAAERFIEDFIAATNRRGNPQRLRHR